MNKTVNINLGGIFFHIDEDAYIKLKKYLDAIRNSLNDNPKEKDEIIKDIEIRISELLSEKIKDIRQVVSVKDVDDIVKIMGKPEDYSIDDVILKDTTEKAKNTSKKKLYRDPEDKFLGGVCSGIAHYIGSDPIWVRLFWLFLAFTYGSGVLIYILLWLLLPVANTTSQKLEMEGEAVNISNIEKKIKEEFKDVSSRIKEGVDDFSNEVKSIKYDSKLRQALQEIIGVLSKIFTIIFKNLGKLIGVFLIFISGVILLSLVISLFSVGSMEILQVNSNHIQYPPFFYDVTIPKGILGIALIFLIGIPFLFLFVLGLKIISSNIKSLTNKVKWSLLGLWLLSLMFIIFSAIEYNLHYLSDATVTVEKIKEPVLSDTLHISLKTKDDFGYSRNQQKIIIDSDKEKLMDTNVHIKIKPIHSNKLKVVVYKKASGITVQQAKKIAENVIYSFKIEDAEISLNNYFLTDPKNKYNRIDVVLYIPKNKIIKLDDTIRNFIKYSSFIDDDFSFNDRDSYSFKMTEEGLVCLDCSVSENLKKEKDRSQKSLDSIVKTDKTPVFSSKNKKSTKKKRVIINENGVKIE